MSQLSLGGMVTVQAAVVTGLKPSHKVIDGQRRRRRQLDYFGTEHACQEEQTRVVGIGQAATALIVVRIAALHAQELRLCLAVVCADVTTDRPGASGKTHFAGVDARAVAAPFLADQDTSTGWPALPQ